MSNLRRIAGLEIEYGITHVGPQALSAEAAAAELFADPELERGANMFLPNGARLYLDVGAHPEYATAECATLQELLNNDRAGSELLAALAARATARLQARGVAGNIHLLRNNLDAEGTSFGCHENYLLRRRHDFHERVLGLVTHLVTRQVITGTGHVVCDPTPRYVLSQRAAVVSDVISAATSRSRPLINTRDEPHADIAQFRRLHLINADTPMAEGTQLILLAAACLLVTALESGARLADLALADPLAALHAVSAQPATVLELANGQRRTALELQAELVERTGSLAAADADPWVRLGHELWAIAVEALRAENAAAVADLLDHVAKRRLLERHCQRHGVDLAHPTTARLAFAYHDIGNTGLRQQLEARGMLRRFTTPSEVTAAKNTPPATRAALRGEAVSVARQMRRDLAVDWTSLRILDRSLSAITLKDPWQTQNPEVEQLLTELRRTEVMPV
ncbi:proteasome accessory factor PafA2 family protein [Buchananella hordeovulneris]|uniref:proteasome accessory factor PafA2 family protein n=1 Tax=Buchananella hordeovulneris TaxID=52770 RepID=UPI000F5E633D|nr:proteasome accessory factor PafA2 family protein [Buchananella hordeovulneris]MDO5080791.1 proteasome accessory factor PafA2 family protein [Buchananella hordeovulneris]RRD45495.1 Pup--protein ligase [Buchananella hordeovulneris]